MARVVDFAFGSTATPFASRRERRHYPWLLWFSGETWEFTPGEDYDGPVSAFRVVICRAAKRLGYAVQTRVKGGRLYMRATKVGA